MADKSDAAVAASSQHCCAHSVWGWQAHKPSDFSHSRFLPLPVFFVVRAVMCLWVFGTSIYGIVANYATSPPGPHFIYFTNLSYFTEAAFFGYGASVSLYHMLRGIPSDTVKDTHWYNKVWYIVYELISANTIIVTVVYWALLATPGVPAGTYSYFAHAVNSPLMVFEVFMNRLRRTPLHVFLHLFAIVGYMFATWIFYAQTATWVYSFLNWYSSLAVAYYIGLLVFFVLVYFLVLGFEAARDAIAHCTHPPANLLPHVEPVTPIDIEMGAAGTETATAKAVSAPADSTSVAVKAEPVSEEAEPHSEKAEPKSEVVVVDAEDQAAPAS